MHSRVLLYSSDSPLKRYIRAFINLHKCIFMTLSITKLTFNVLNPIKRFTLDKNTSKSGTDPSFASAAVNEFDIIAGCVTIV